MKNNIFFHMIYEHVHTPIFIIHINKEGSFVFGDINPAFEQMTGFCKEDILEKLPEEIPGFSKEESDLLCKNCRHCIEALSSTEYEGFFGGDDNRKWYLVQLSPARDSAGNFNQIVGSLKDISDLKRLEELLKISEEKYRVRFEESFDGLFITSPEGKILDMNKKGIELFGYDTKEEVLELDLERDVYYYPEDRKRILAMINEQGTAEYEVAVKKKNGEKIITYCSLSVVTDETGKKTSYRGIIRDITKRKMRETIMQARLRLLEFANSHPMDELLTATLDEIEALTGSSIGFYHFLEADQKTLSLANWSTNTLKNMCTASGKGTHYNVAEAGVWVDCVPELKPIIHNDYVSLPHRKGLPEGHAPVKREVVVPIFRGPLIKAIIGVGNKQTDYDETDIEILSILGDLSWDIVERKRAEERMKESEEKYRLLITNANEAIFVIQDNVVKFPNPKALNMTGYSSEELGKKPFIDLIQIEDRNTFLEGYLKLLEGESINDSHPFRIINKTGKVIWVHLTTAPITWEKKPGILCFFRDVTEEKKLEVQVIQAQKMEAVGRLAGGVAHDFNNMLGVIIGHTDLALARVAESDLLNDPLQKIKKAALRSADLTKQLLAFARKQTIAPKVLDLNETISGMLNMLRRLIGENIDLKWIPGENLWPVRMDPIQIDRVLANLCLNARDAITSVGKVIIETKNVVFDEAYCALYTGFIPGEFVLFSVNDNGCGMEKETQLHLFEPFFTTKGVGQGTGLGLASVYGIVKQNNGFINVYSEPGEGTIFRIYLPRYLGTDESPLMALPIEEQAANAHEIILLVEDEPEVLDMTCSMLEELGYKVLTANTPGKALQLAKEKSNEIQLVLTDVVMPEMNGPDLIKKLRYLYPNLKWLYMSGYTSSVIAQWGVLEERVHFIQKPFSMNELSEKIREALKAV